MGHLCRCCGKKFRKSKHLAQHERDVHPRTTGQGRFSGLLAARSFQQFDMIDAMRFLLKGR